VELLLKMISEALVEVADTAGVVPGVVPFGDGSAGAGAAASSPLLQLLAKALEALLRNQDCRVGLFSLALKRAVFSPCLNSRESTPSSHL
jgi:hypothetical protein